MKSPADVVVHIEWTVSRKTDIKDSTGKTTNSYDVILPADINGEPNPARKTLVDMLITNGSIPSNNATIIIPHLFPKFLKVTSRSTDVVPQLMQLSSLQCKNHSKCRIRYKKRNTYIYILK